MIADESRDKNGDHGEQGEQDEQCREPCCGKAHPILVIIVVNLALEKEQ